MAPPSIIGDPKIVQDTKTNSVNLEVVVEGKWYLLLINFIDL